MDASGLLLAAALLAAPVAGAAEPVLKHFFPLSGQRGTTVSATATGTFETWPPQVWVDAPGLTFRGAAEKGKLTVEVAADAPLGPHLVRFFSPQGASAPRYFIVSAEPEQLEAEPNDDFKAPQKIDRLPVTIDGRLEKAGDVDSFAVTLKQGQPLTATVEAYVLGSPFDGMLRLVDATGTQLAFNHDGRTLDPLLSWTAPRDGTFVVQLMGFAYPPGSNVNFAGSESCLYRLRLAAELAPRATLPPAELPEQPEQEPNDMTAQAGPLNIPGSVSGAVQKSGDEDRFAFTAVKGTAYELSVLAARSGSPLEAWLKIETPEGKELARNDGTGSVRDPQLVWKSPADGVYIAALGDVAHHGGDEYFYRLSIKEAVPAVSGTAAIHSVVVSAEKGGELKVAVKRTNGFKAALLLVAKDLPEGVSAPEIDVPEKDGDIMLKLTAAKEAAPVSQPLRVVLREKESGLEYPVRYYLPAFNDTVGGPRGYPDLLIDSTEVLWIATPGKAEPAK